MIEVVSESPEQTLDIGRRLATLLRAGDIVLLIGRLGCGKTLLAGGIAEGMGVQEPVTSPSFVIVHEYDGFLKIIHADMYRVDSIGEFDDLELMNAARDGVLIVEWGDAVASAIPDHLRVEMAFSGDDTRTLRLVPVGSWAGRPLAEFAE